MWRSNFKSSRSARYLLPLALVLVLGWNLSHTDAQLTIVNNICTRGVSWQLNVTTSGQTWCLSCFCVSGAVSLCRIAALQGLQCIPLPIIDVGDLLLPPVTLPPGIITQAPTAGPVATTPILPVTTVPPITVPTLAPTVAPTVPTVRPAIIVADLFSPPPITIATPVPSMVPAVVRLANYSPAGPIPIPYQSMGAYAGSQAPVYNPAFGHSMNPLFPTAAAG